MAMLESTAVRLAKHDRLVVIAAITLLSLAAWGYLIIMTLGMLEHVRLSGLGPGMGLLDGVARGLGLATGEGSKLGDWLAGGGDLAALCLAGLDSLRLGFGTPQLAAWGGADLLLVYVMWVVMAVAMMLPTAAPTILTHAEIVGAAKDRGLALPSTAQFVTGYLGVWAGVCLVATLAQWGLQSLAWMSPTMVSANGYFGAAVLLGAALYQWSPVKEACLSLCRSPMKFFLANWRDGRFGSLRMGARHGLYCVGCCWALMTVMYVAGVMNLMWIALLGSVMLLEKVLSRGRLLAHLSGLVLGLWGLGLLAVTLLR